MIKILVEGFPENYGGIATIVTNIINQLDEEFYFDIIETYEYKGKDKIKNKNVSFVKLPIFKKNYLKYKSELKKLFEKNKYDFVWINNTSKVNIQIFTLAKKNNVKTIAHCHGERNEGNFLKVLIMNLISKANEKSFYKNLDICFSCSNNASNYFYNKKKLNEKQIHLINNGIEINTFLFNKEIRKNYQKTLNVENKIVLGMVGRLDRIKNPIFLLKLIKDLPDKYILLFVGSGNFEKKIKRYIKNKNIEDRVILLGARNDVSNIYQAIDILLMPSICEGLPLTLVEAQASGLVCIASDTITKDVNFSKKIIYLPLNDLYSWKKEILNISEYDRNLKNDEIYNNQFLISNSAFKFKEIILNEF